MKKIKILLFVTVIVLSISISGCDMLLGGEMPNYDDLEDFENGDNGGGDNDSGTTDNDGTADHVCDFVAVSYVESTCSAAGKDTYKCSCGKTKEEPRDLAPHTEQIIPATEATDNSPATTAGVRCSACGYIIVQPDVVFSSDFTTPDRYDGSYAYNYLSTLKNGENLTKLYNSIDIVADYFHISGKDASDDLVVSEINFSQYGLTSEEALAVWSAYVIDHPLYYWMSKNITYMSTALSIKVDEDYMSGAVRNEYNAKIYAKAEAFIKEINSDSKYLIAMMLHDLIISSGDYAYEADGVTPKDDVYAHNILGILEMGEGVCESYAKSFQMMLNYCGVENVMVSGYAGEAHAWNLVKLDDEKWYWCDLTWDDNPGFINGISYRYFCVGNTDALMGTDGPWQAVGLLPFAESHIPSEKCDVGVDFAYALPESSDVNFASSEFLLRTVFKSGDFTYAITDANSVQLVKIERAGSVVIPESVEYNGRVFTVTSIGCIDENGLFKIGSLVAEYYDRYGGLSLPITPLYIPKTVEIIWDDALNIQTLESIVVDNENEVFTAVDGVLFTKDLKTLIKYPASKADSTYTIPDETENIAAFAFAMYFSNLELYHLETIILGENTASAGITYFGYGYENSDKGNFREGEWVKIEFYLKGDGKIFTKSGFEFSYAA